MTPSGKSYIDVSADLIVGKSEPADASVRVEPFGRGACLTITTENARWRLAFGPDGGAFIAGALASECGVRFDDATG